MLGGLIHPEDEAELRDMGVKGIFGPGSTTVQIVDFMQRISGKSIGGRLVPSH
jgi:methylmalonyl-CoA mutase, C-terminal domain